MQKEKRSTLDYALIDLFTKMTTIGPKMPLLRFSEPSLGLLRRLSWAAQKARLGCSEGDKNLKKRTVWALGLGRSGGVAAAPRPCRELLWAENHPSLHVSSQGWDVSSHAPGMLGFGPISSQHPNILAQKMRGGRGRRHLGRRGARAPATKIDPGPGAKQN